jgi:hypothetical protein
MLASCERVVEPVQVANGVVIELIEEGHRFIEHVLGVAAQLYSARARAQGPKPECDPGGGS